MDQQVILIVEDEVLVRMVMADVLREAGYLVVEASSADEGLQIARSRQPIDLMITDVRMPGEIDGIELIRHSKQIAPERPVIMTSGHLGREATYPGDAFLAKPYGNAQLLRTVEQLIGSPCRDSTQGQSAS